MPSEAEMIAKLFQEKGMLEIELSAQKKINTELAQKLEMLTAKVEQLSVGMSTETEKSPLDNVDVAELIVHAEKRKIRHYEGGLGKDEVTKD